MAPRPQPPRGRFWDKVDRAHEHGCWNWTGFCEPHGYGVIAVDRYKRVKAHRVSWEIHNGAIPDGLCVLHECDNRRCVNPRHLYLGTRADNNRDRGLRRRGKEHRQNGAANDNAKLTEADVRAIDALLKTDRTQAEIAALFGVKQPQVSRIKLRQSWAHLWSE